MVLNVLFSFIISITLLICIPGYVSAAESPLNTSNNKAGVHILFPDEVEDAAKLINSSGGDYGYVTIAIQSGDKDIEKWQNFLDKCKRLHVVPLIRIATESNPFNTAVWSKPTDYDIIDFANFLDSLNWPYKNRYIIVYNEVNRGDEWGGNLDASEYARILSFAVTVFKSKSPDFFIISAGLDNASPDKATQYMNQYNYMQQMNRSVPGIFNQVDGLSSHSYPNPGFSQPPTANSPTSINSFQYEKAYVKALGSKDLPIFITETGWSTEVLSDNLAASYYITAFNTTWNDSNIVAITPFLLQGRGGPFQKFSLIGDGSKFTQQYNAIKNLKKVKGNPKISTSVLSASTNTIAKKDKEIVDFSKSDYDMKTATISGELKTVFKWLLKIE
ncbi:MAG TPA: hypothetical protein VM077_06270 [Candidatus Limnocylindrales bacterium]|nr:hypothetical protein [Candidatus Limnocylindrales bacterium]